jgi:hypothetical protein
MGLITWDKPKKARSTGEHNDMFSSDSGVDGTYVPNMSREDKAKWKGKVAHTTTSPQVEIRKDTFVVVVGLDGYNYKYYRRVPERHSASTKGLNIHIASAGPIQLTFEQWEDFKTVVEEAKEKLKGMA